MGQTLSRDEYERRIFLIKQVGEMTRLCRAGTGDGCRSAGREALQCLKGTEEESVCLRPFIECFQQQPDVALRAFVSDAPKRCAKVAKAAVFDLRSLVECVALEDDYARQPFRVPAEYFECGAELEAARKCRGPFRAECFEETVPALKACEERRRRFH